MPAKSWDYLNFLSLTTKILLKLTSSAQTHYSITVVTFQSCRWRTNFQSFISMIARTKFFEDSWNFVSVMTNDPCRGWMLKIDCWLYPMVENYSTWRLIFQVSALFYITWNWSRFSSLFAVDKNHHFGPRIVNTQIKVLFFTKMVFSTHFDSENKWILR